MTLTLPQLIELENNLNQVKFRDIPLGGLCANFLYSGIYFLPYRDSFRRKILSAVVNYRENMNVVKSLYIQPPPPSAKRNIVFNISANVPKNIAFFQPIHDQFNTYQCCVISKEQEAFSIRTNDVYFTYSNLSAEQFSEWKNTYTTIKKKINQITTGLQQKFALPWSFVQELKFTIKHQTKACIFFIDLLKQLKPVAIISDHDRHGINASLILSANKLNIPTFTFIHGSTYPADHYYPLLARYMICWGNEHKKQFHQLGIDNERLIVCGNQKINRGILSKPENIKKKIGFNQNDRVILLATNVISEGQRLQYARDFCLSLQSLPGWKGVVRIHPSENISEYKTISDKYPAIKFTDNSTVSFDESMALADYIVCHNSLYGLDALIKRKQVVLFAPPYVTFPLGIGEELHQKAGCELLKSIEDMVSFFKSVIKDEISLSPKAEQYIQSYISAFGEDAARSVYNEVIKRIK